MTYMEFLLAVPCGLGTYLSPSEYCEKCPMGPYQDEVAQSSCKTCPKYTTTKGTGSQSVQECLGKCPKYTTTEGTKGKSVQECLRKCPKYTIAVAT